MWNLRRKRSITGEWRTRIRFKTETGARLPFFLLKFETVFEERFFSQAPRMGVSRKGAKTQGLFNIRIAKADEPETSPYPLRRGN